MKYNKKSVIEIADLYANLFHWDAEVKAISRNMNLYDQLHTGASFEVVTLAMETIKDYKSTVPKEIRKILGKNVNISKLEKMCRELRKK